MTQRQQPERNLALELTRVTGLTFNAEDVPPMVSVAGKIACSRPIMVDHFQYLKSVATRMPKFTMPSPGSAHFRGGRNAISRTVYPDLEELWADLGAAYLGTQGDIWDAQKDMACAFIGAVLIAMWLTIVPRMRSEPD